jgi:hypothetical protein
MINVPKPMSIVRAKVRLCDLHQREKEESFQPLTVFLLNISLFCQTCPTGGIQRNPPVNLK